MIKSILIVGGGSAGWITANLLNASLNKDGNGQIAITLLESPDIPKIGVGEATVPNIRQTLYDIGLNEYDFMKATDATFKTMIRFVDWRVNSYYDHPFDRCFPNETASQVHAWLQKNPDITDQNEFAEAFSLLTHLSNSSFAPKTTEMDSFQSPFPYAYHLDAFKLASYLTAHGKRQGIHHHIANVTDVKVDEAGFITKVLSDDETEHSADLYIDCTGFKSILHKQKLKIKSKSFSKYLLCDRAVAMNVPYDVYQPEKLNPFTTSTAMPAGWIWDIVLQNRRGLGYVYSSQFETREGAEKTFREKEGVHAQNLSVQHINFQSQCSESAWSGNCVAIGLSGGFVEPLESSGIYLVEFAAKTLCGLVPYIQSNMTSIAKTFNRQMGLVYTEILEYLNLHYCLSNRTDSEFWREVQKSEHILPSLQDKLELWKTKPPQQSDFDHLLHLFPIASFEYILFGMGYKPQNLPDFGGNIPNLSEAISHSIERLPKHIEFVDQLK
ncbi:MAG TPA: tryptophan 7-halogenase [Gammaproteobacteria bacterium]|nr:tryptophan 7-halogenase [Gammaproteobacteria bacterium]